MFPFCVRAKFWDRLILPQILFVFKSQTTKIGFADFLQIQAAVWKTNYTTFKLHNLVQSKENLF